jgi:hypothetical protein
MLTWNKRLLVSFTGGYAMRQLVVVTVILAVIGVVQADPGGAVKCKAEGMHICCKQCKSVTTGLLEKVEGISKIEVDIPNKTVTFEAKDAKAAEAAFAAIQNGGFFGTFTAGDKAFKPAAVKVDAKGDDITVKSVHVCCGMCQTAVKGLFKDSKVTFTGKGAQKDVLISGKNLDGQAVLEALQKSGFSGTVEGKK